MPGLWQVLACVLQNVSTGIDIMKATTARASMAGATVCKNGDPLTLPGSPVLYVPEGVLAQWDPPSSRPASLVSEWRREEPRDESSAAVLSKTCSAFLTCQTRVAKPEKHRREIDMVYTQTHAHTSTPTHPHMHARTHAHTHTPHTHTHTHTHTESWAACRRQTNHRN